MYEIFRNLPEGVDPETLRELWATLPGEGDAKTLDEHECSCARRGAPDKDRQCGRHGR